MSSANQTARLANIRLHPIKSLDPVGVMEGRIGSNGGLELDRVWELTTVEGGRINGKRYPAVHHIRADYETLLQSVTLSVSGCANGSSNKLQTAKFAFPSGYQQAAQWFSEYFGRAVIVRHIPEGVPDDGLAPGPTIVSTASLQQVCDTFPGVDLQQARERFRTTLEIDGVPAFWEDQLFSPDENYVVRFKIGAVALEGSNPCARCPVPPRNPRTGEETSGFQKTFAEMRRNSLPSWSAEERFDHYYRLATNTRVPFTEQGKLLRLGDSVSV